MFHRSLSRLVVTSVFGVAGMTVGCGDSPSSPTPTPMPATSSPAGLTLRSVSPISGPTGGGDFISVQGEGFQAGATVMFDGVAAQVTKVNDRAIQARTPAHPAGTVDVLVTNPDGRTQRLPASYTFAVFSVTASPNVVAAGGAVTVTWVAPSGRGCSGGGDWIAIYKMGDPDQTGAANGHSDLWYDHVCGATSGSWTISAPAQPGEYEFRFLVGDTSVARSSPVTVRGE